MKKYTIEFDETLSLSSIKVLVSEDGEKPKQVGHMTDINISLSTSKAMNYCKFNMARPVLGSESDSAIATSTETLTGGKIQVM